MAGAGLACTRLTPGSLPRECANAQEWKPCRLECGPLTSPSQALCPCLSQATLSPVAASGPEDVALYVGLIAVAVCLVLLLLVLILVYCRKKEGLDSDVADSSILTSGFQPVSIKPSKAGAVAPIPNSPPQAYMPIAAEESPQHCSLSLSLSPQTIPICSPSSQTSAPPPPPTRGACVPGRTGPAPSSS